MVKNSSLCKRFKRNGLDPWSGRSPGIVTGNPLQYSYLENPMDRGAWRAIVHGVANVGDNLKPPPPSCPQFQPSS